ncbi:MAG: hypothetical protein OEZ10_11205 [Gammaproteobacteria bacterium]|nr:hypothetical protein [Gammaproteobacteria bacterium]
MQSTVNSSSSVSSATEAVATWPVQLAQGFRDQALAIDKLFNAVAIGQVDTMQADGTTGQRPVGSVARPDLFLQTYLDMLRVIYEPAPLAPFYLNNNPELLSSRFPESVFDFGYETFVSSPVESFSVFFEDSVLPVLQAQGYERDTLKSAFFAVSVGQGRHNLTEMTEILSTLRAGLSVNENVVMHSSFRKKKSAVIHRENVFVGMARDESLGDRCRLSVWLFSDKA